MSASARKKDYQKKLPVIVEALKANYKPQKIILFGSMLDPKKSSNDVDLFLIKKTPLKRLGDRAGEARKHLPFNDIPIDLIVYTPDEVNHFLGRSVLLNEIFKGRVLYDSKSV